MNWLDVVLGGILASSTVAGLFKGFVRTAVGMATSILAILLSLWFYGSAAAVVREYTSSAAVANAIGFLAVFAAVLIAGALLARLLAMAFKWAGLGWLDRLLGGAFGLARGLLISTAVVMAAMAFSVNPPPKSVVESEIAPYVLEAARVAARLAPEELTAAVEKSYAKIREVWASAWKKGLLEKSIGR